MRIGLTLLFFAIGGVAFAGESLNDLKTFYYLHASMFREFLQINAPEGSQPGDSAGQGVTGHKKTNKTTLL